MEPIIPKRPVKNTTPSPIEVNTSENQEAKLELSTDGSPPIIPSRPKSKKAIKSDSETNRVDLESNDTSSKDATVDLQTTDPVADTNISIDTGSIVSDEPLKDGEKTPGNSNSKTSFKDVDDETSFDDDETIKTGPTNTSEVNEFLENELQDNDVLQDIAQTEDKDSQNDKDSSLKCMSEIPANNAKVTSIEESPSSDEIGVKEESELNEKGDEDIVQASILSQDEQSQQTEVVEELVVLSDSFQQDKSPINDENLEEETESKHSMPIIPMRPKKAKQLSTGDLTKNSSSDSVPSIPSRPNKMPPPKPKKLSSKIAAFQQFLNNEPEPAKPSPKPKTDTRGKLSSSHMKFAQNLQGIMGKGIPLPGMMDPRMRSNESLVEGKGVEEDDKYPDKTGDTGEATEDKEENKPIRRAKGPKGKRLPKNLSTPVNIESSNKFKIATGDLWTVEVRPKEQVEVKLEDMPGIEGGESSETGNSERMAVDDEKHVEDSKPDSHDDIVDEVAANNDNPVEADNQESLSKEGGSFEEENITESRKVENLDEEFDFGTPSQTEPSEDSTNYQSKDQESLSACKKEDVPEYEANGLETDIPPHGEESDKIEPSMNSSHEIIQNSPDEIELKEDVEISS